jgi:hypothetical protein
MADRAGRSRRGDGSIRIRARSIRIPAWKRASLVLHRQGEEERRVPLLQGEAPGRDHPLLGLRHRLRLTPPFARNPPRS